jgi:thioesterase domain-containing protein/acyl carrier protein
VEAKETFTAPESEIEKNLAEIWSEILHVDRAVVGVDESFFELGGHSLNATVMVSRIHKELGVKVPLVEIFSSPTIRGLAEYIKSAGRERIQKVEENLVLLKKGSVGAPNLFLVHDGSGQVEGYAEFCRLPAVDFNCWGVRADSLENYTPLHRSTEEIAKSYLERIKQIQPQGPYYIAGWSVGGTIAFETARQLEEMNESIGFLGLIDSLPPQKTSAKKSAEMKFDLKAEAKWISKLLPGKKLRREIQRISEPHRLWLFIIEYLEENRIDPDSIKRAVPPHMAAVIPHFDSLETTELIHGINLNRTLINMRDTYIPAGKIRTVLHFFKASRSEYNEDIWDLYCREPLIRHEVPGDHFSILRMPDVGDFAELFAGVLNGLT